MKILFNHTLPFALSHGGFQTQIEETMAALLRRGVEVDHLRWWDDGQRGDVIHHFGAPPMAFLKLARDRHIPSVVTHLFSSTCNRSPLHLKLQGLLTRPLLFSFPRGIRNQLNWQTFRNADRMIVGLEAERYVLETVYGLNPEAIALVPLGLHRDFLEAAPASRNERFLITTGTITAQKRSIELARMAREAEVPILFVGKPYDSTDSYGKEFAAMVDGKFVLHHGHVAERSRMIDLLRSSRGFVLYSEFENWCLSAHEAAACGLPVLLPDLPWSRERFGSQASYLHARSRPGNVARLRAFYDGCATRPGPNIRLYSWDDVAEKLEACYRSVI